jgi:hypothetical protein
MAPTASPDEGMLVLVPVGSGAFNRLLDLGPGLEASPFQGQGAQHLPPGLDQVEVGRVLGLEDELPARMEQAEQQNIRRAVGAEVVPPPALPYMRRFMSSVSVMHDCPSDLVEWLAKGGAQYTSCGTKIRITLYPVGSP